MSIGDRLVVAMEPGQRHDVNSLAAAIREEYPDVVFSLARLNGFGFVDELDDDLYSLTATGVQLHRILSAGRRR